MRPENARNAPRGFDSAGTQNTPAMQQFDEVEVTILPETAEGIVRLRIFAPPQHTTTCASVLMAVALGGVRVHGDAPSSQALD